MDVLNYAEYEHNESAEILRSYQSPLLVQDRDEHGKATTPQKTSHASHPLLHHRTIVLHVAFFVLYTLIFGVAIHLSQIYNNEAKPPTNPTSHLSCM